MKSDPQDIVSPESIPIYVHVNIVYQMCFFTVYQRYFGSG